MSKVSTLLARGVCKRPYFYQLSAKILERQQIASAIRSVRSADQTKHSRLQLPFDNLFLFIRIVSFRLMLTNALKSLSFMKYNERYGYY